MTLTSGQVAVVVDASAMVEVLIGNERWQDRLADWQAAGAVILAPAHFRVEIANALLRGVGLEPADAIARVRLLFAAGVDVADRGLSGAFDAVELADRHRLTVYDAAYLSLALDIDGELATEDKALIRAASAEGVRITA